MFTLAVLAFAGFTGFAHAAAIQTIDVEVGSDGLPHVVGSAPLVGGTELDLTLGAAIAGPGNKYQLSALNFGGWSTNAGSAVNLVSAPAYSYGPSLSVPLNGGNYLSVGGSIFGYADFKGFSAPSNEFGFTWLNPSNIDINVITSDNSTPGFTISYNDLKAYINGTGPVNLVILDPYGTLTDVQFLNISSPAFLAANFYDGHTNFSTVPLPGALGLFLAGMSGLFVARRKKLI